MSETVGSRKFFPPFFSILRIKGAFMTIPLDFLALLGYDGTMDCPDEVRKFFSACGRKGGAIGGRIGGRARVKKGFACMTLEQRRAAQAKGVASRLRHKLDKDS